VATTGKVKGKGNPSAGSGPRAKRAREGRPAPETEALNIAGPGSVVTEKPVKRHPKAPATIGGLPENLQPTAPSPQTILAVPAATAVIGAFEAGSKVVRAPSAPPRSSLTVAPTGPECAACGCRHFEKEMVGARPRLVCRHCGRSRPLAAVAPPEGARGLTCGRCGGTEFEVENTDQIPIANGGGVRRYRRCRCCGQIKTTMER